MANSPRFSFWNTSFFITLCVLILSRGVVSAIFLYQYIIFSSIDEFNKGGTFVEAITEPMSYLPYRGDPEKNLFYQTLLFPGCEGGLGEDLCTITTTDNQNYYISIKDNFEWSDGTPFTLADVLFSYQDIIIANLRNQPYLSKYHDILIQNNEEEQIVRFTFPTSNPDNRKFFQFPIIPLHILQTYSLENYVSDFASDPITVGCAKYAPSKDGESLVFNLSTCESTNINYYQFKFFPSLSSLQETISKPNPIVSFYYGNIESEHYRLLSLKDSNYLSFFFNTKSTKLTPRIQRSIGGFINHQLWKLDHTGYLGAYEGLFSRYVTTGENMVSYIEEKNPYLTYDKSLLEQGGVRSLPHIFTIDRAKRKYAFYLNPTTEVEHSFTIETADPVSNIRGTSDKSVRNLVINSDESGKKHTITFTIGAEQQIQEGLNHLTIKGTVLGKDQEVASIDLYFLGRTSTTEQNEALNKIKIITLNNKISNYIRVQLQNIFADTDTSHLFEFKVYNTQEDFLEAIRIKDYDMVLTTMQMRGLDDIYKILSSTALEINPSGYHNAVLNDFLRANNREQARNIIASDMPFFIVGQLMKPYWLQSDIQFSPTENYDEKSLRSSLLHNISLVSHRRLQGKLLIDKYNFLNFLEEMKN